MALNLKEFKTHLDAMEKRIIASYDKSINVLIKKVSEIKSI